ncbi:MAG: response regulator transcription factor [Lachnospiraceae bacterium]|nr:response regulator transcription factor [Lachnospiraceae bacterium]
MTNYILIVEDDNDISHMLKELLQQNGYETAQAFSGTEALFYIERELPAAMILDLMLPGMNGEDLLLKMKKEHPEIAVIISSAKEDIQTRVSMLRSGADDYITKPFDTEELLARLEAVLRRSGKSIAIWNQENNKEPLEEENRRKLQYKDILMEPEEFRITVAGNEVRLTRREYLILELLMENPGKVFTKNNIYESVWNEEFLGEDNAVNVHISNIRQKLAKANSEETYIETVWGIGFKMK